MAIPRIFLFLVPLTYLLRSAIAEVPLTRLGSEMGSTSVETPLTGNDNEDTLYTLQEYMVQLIEAKELMQECTGRTLTPAAKEPSSHTIAPPKGDLLPKHLHKTVNIFTAFLDEKKTGKYYASLIRLVHKFSVGGDEFSTILTMLATRTAELTHQIGVVSSAIESLPEQLKATLRMNEYTKQRDQVKLTENKLWRLLRDRNLWNWDHLSYNCNQTDSLIETLNYIDSMVEDGSDYFGNFVKMLFVASNRDRRRFVWMADDVQDTLCRLVNMHSVCSAVLDHTAPQQKFYKDWIQNKTAKIIEKLQEADADLEHNFLEDAQEYLNKIPEPDLENAAQVQDKMQLQFYWLDVSVVSYASPTRDKGVAYSVHVASPDCVVQRFGDQFNVIVYFSDKERKSELSQYLNNTKHFFTNRGNMSWILITGRDPTDDELVDLEHWYFNRVECLQYVAANVVDVLRHRNKPMPAATLSQYRAGGIECPSWRFPENSAAGLVTKMRSVWCGHDCIGFTFLNIFPYCTLRKMK